MCDSLEYLMWITWKTTTTMWYKNLQKSFVCGSVLKLKAIVAHNLWFFFSLVVVWCSSACHWAIELIMHFVLCFFNDSLAENQLKQTQSIDSITSFWFYNPKRLDIFRKCFYANKNVKRPIYTKIDNGNYTWQFHESIMMTKIQIFLVIWYVAIVQYVSVFIKLSFAIKIIAWKKGVELNCIYIADMNSPNVCSYICWYEQSSEKKKNVHDLLFCILSFIWKWMCHFRIILQLMNK